MTVKIGLADCLDEYLSLRDKARVVELTSDEQRQSDELRNVLNRVRLPLSTSRVPNFSDSITDARALDAEVRHRREVEAGRARPWIPSV